MTTENNVADISKHLNEVRKNQNRRPAKGSFAKNSGRLSAKVRQYDFLINDQGSGSDEDGDRLLYVNTDESMTGADVRVLVKTDADLDDVVRALIKIAEWVMAIKRYEKETKDLDLPF